MTQYLNIDVVQQPKTLGTTDVHSLSFRVLSWPLFFDSIAKGCPFAVLSCRAQCGRRSDDQTTTVGTGRKDNKWTPLCGTIGKQRPRKDTKGQRMDIDRSEYLWMLYNVDV